MQLRSQSSVSDHESTRRKFLTTTSAALATALTGVFSTTAATEDLLAVPTVQTISRTRQSMIVGDGEYTYEIQHNWPQLPDKYFWQTTHNVALDKAGNLYVIHEGRADLKDHPAIFVFDQAGKFMRAFGSQFQGGGHGIEVRDEEGTEFLYVAAYQQVKAIAKLDLNGNVIWHCRAPMESGIYAAGEDKTSVANWGRDRFLPTNFAFLPDGDLLLADGYGSFFIHRYDKEGNWKTCFGGPGKGEGKFDTPHGIWLDSRNEQEPKLVIADRAHHTLQFLTLEGTYLETKSGFGLPANLDIYKHLLLVPELQARISILNKENEVVAVLGDDRQRVLGEGGNQIRNHADRWQPGKFVHPHDACFDQQGNILVAEWVSTGRVSRLKRVH